MHKHFFKFDNLVTIKDILNILEISDSIFLLNNLKKNVTILDTNVLDIVSYKNLSINRLSYFSDKKKIDNNIKNGIIITEQKNICLMNSDIIIIPHPMPKLAFHKILNFYFDQCFLKSKIYSKHSSALIDSKATIGKNVNIGPFTIIEEGAIIEDNSYISERVTISKNCKIGQNSFVGAGTFIENSIIGDNVRISSNSVIGKNGFGFIPNKINTSITPHLGAVIIGNNTNIGSCCTIDRGLLDNTTIGNFVMIDNQVHIGHNCLIEDFCILAGKVGTSGSVSLGQHVIVGGGVNFSDNITIGENSLIAGASNVFNSFPENSKIGGSPAQDLMEWKKLIVSQRLNLKKRKK